MTLSFAEDVRNDMLGVVNTQVNAGAAAGYVEVRSGTRPANADTAATGTVLATLTLVDPAFSAPAAGVMDLDADPDITGTAAATGTASWARVYDSDANAVFDGDVATSAADWIITSTSITSGQTVNLTLGSLTRPA